MSLISLWRISLMGLICSKSLVSVFLIPSLFVIHPLHPPPTFTLRPSSPSPPFKDTSTNSPAGGSAQSKVRVLFVTSGYSRLTDTFQLARLLKTLQSYSIRALGSWRSLVRSPSLPSPPYPTLLCSIHSHPSHPHPPHPSSDPLSA